MEDETAILDIETTMLRRHGFRVIPSSSAEEVLQIARSYPDTIDLLLADVVMLEMNGHQLSRELLTLHPKAKHLYMSGYTSKLVTPKDEAQANLCFNQKPFTKKYLLRIFFSLL